MTEAFFASVTREIILFIIIGLIGALGSGFYAFLRNLKKCTDKNTNALATLKRAFALYVQVDLIESKKFHPQETMLEMKSLVDTILKENGEQK